MSITITDSCLQSTVSELRDNSSSEANKLQRVETYDSMMDDDLNCVFFLYPLGKRGTQINTIVIYSVASFGALLFSENKPNYNWEVQHTKKYRATS